MSTSLKSVFNGNSTWTPICEPNRKYEDLKGLPVLPLRSLCSRRLAPLFTYFCPFPEYCGSLFCRKFSPILASLFGLGVMRLVALPTPRDKRLRGFAFPGLRHWFVGIVGGGRDAEKAWLACWLDRIRNL